MKRLIIALGVAIMFVVVGRCADVPTNIWVGASGGSWEESTNWSNPSLITDGSTFFALFTNEATSATSPFAVTTTSSPKVYGVSYAPPTASSTKNYMTLGGFTYVTNTAFTGRARLVAATNTTLTLTAPITREDETSVIETTGSGTVQFSSNEPSFISLRISAGVVTPTTRLALAGTEVSTMNSKAGEFKLVCDAVVRDLPTDSARVKGVELDKYELALGGFSDTRFKKWNAYNGSGTLAVQNGASLGIFRQQSGYPIALVLRNADLGLYNCYFDKLAFNNTVSDYTNLDASRFARYSFDDPDAPWANAFPPGFAALVKGEGGEPEVQVDESRGRVAYFNGTTSLVGSGDNGVLANMPTGASATYTIAFWMKAEERPASGTVLYSWGNVSGLGCSRLLVGDNSKGLAFVVSHYGTSMDVSNENASGAFDGSWHHIAVTREGGSDTFWLDGSSVCTSKINEDLKVGKFCVGEGFKGWIDDFTFVNGKNIGSTVKDATFSPQTVFRSKLVARWEGGGTLTCNGGQVFAGLEGDSVTGMLKLTGDQSLVGTTAKQTYSWRGSVTGWGDLVMNGTNATQILYGPQNFTGDIRVEAGTLELRPLDSTNNVPQTLARWTFDDTENPYASTGSGGEFVLSTHGSASVSKTDDQRSGGVLDLTGGDASYLKASSIPNWMPNKGSFTVAFWVRPKTGSGTNPYFWYGNSGGNAAGYLIAPWNDVSLRFEHASGTTLDADCLPFCGGAASQWTHVTCVYDATEKTLSLYFDGACVAQNTNVEDSEISYDSLFIGCGNDSTAGFNGWMDDVCVWLQALTPAQVRAHCATGAGRLAEPQLSSQTGIAVSNDATFVLGEGAVTTAATLSGAGTVSLGENACLTVAGGGIFDGTLSGNGVLALSGGTLTKTDGSALAIDLAIADGFSFTTDENGTGLPVANTSGMLTLPVNGTVTFDCERADVLGKTFTIAKGGTVTKVADLLTGWNVVCTDATRKCVGRFAIKDGEFTVTVSTPGIMILVR